MRLRSLRWVLVGSLARLARCCPVNAVRMAGLYGRLLGSRSSTLAPSREELLALLGPTTDDELVRLRLEIAASEIRNRVITQLVQRHGPGALSRLIRLENESLPRKLLESRRPTLLLIWHLGVPRAIPAGLAAASIPALVGQRGVSRASRTDELAPLQFHEIHDGSLHLSFLMRATRILKGGGMVQIAADGQQGEICSSTPFLGGALRLRRGPAALARMTGAERLPVTACWSEDGAHIQIRFHPPLPAPETPPEQIEAHEQEILSGIAGWFESYLRMRPECLRLRSLRAYLNARSLLR